MANGEHIAEIDRIPVETLHLGHPNLRAEDWRSPLVRRLSDSATYAEGEQTISDSHRGDGGAPIVREPTMTWHGLRDDFKKCMATYQAPVITEFATLGLACILVARRTGLAITEVTRRGEKADYWLGDR